MRIIYKNSLLRTKKSTRYQLQEPPFLQFFLGRSQLDPFPGPCLTHLAHLGQAGLELGRRNGTAEVLQDLRADDSWQKGNPPVKSTAKKCFFPQKIRHVDDHQVENSDHFAIRSLFHGVPWVESEIKPINMGK